MWIGIITEKHVEDTHDNSYEDVKCTMFEQNRRSSLHAGETVNVLFCCLCVFFSKLLFSTHSFWNTIGVDTSRKSIFAFILIAGNQLTQITIRLRYQYFYWGHTSLCIFAKSIEFLLPVPTIEKL